MANEVGILRDQQRKTVERVKATERATLEMARIVKELTKKCNRMEKELNIITDRLEDAEGRSRRHNVRLVGVPERLERPNVELFVEEWLTKTVLQDKQSKFFSVECAHRVPGMRPRPGLPPRPIIIRISETEITSYRLPGRMGHGKWKAIMLIYTQTIQI